MKAPGATPKGEVSKPQPITWQRLVKNNRIDRYFPQAARKSIFRGQGVKGEKQEEEKGVCFPGFRSETLYQKRSEKGPLERKGKAPPAPEAFSCTKVRQGAPPEGRAKKKIKNKEKAVGQRPGVAIVTALNCPQREKESTKKTKL